MRLSWPVCGIQPHHVSHVPPVSVSPVTSQPTPAMAPAAYRTRYTTLLRPKEWVFPLAPWAAIPSSRLPSPVQIPSLLIDHLCPLRLVIKIGRDRLSIVARLSSSVPLHTPRYKKADSSCSLILFIPPLPSPESSQTTSQTPTARTETYTCAAGTKDLDKQQSRPQDASPDSLEASDLPPTHYRQVSSLDIRTTMSDQHYIHQSDGFGESLSQRCSPSAQPPTTTYPEPPYSVRCYMTLPVTLLGLSKLCHGV